MDPDFSKILSRLENLCARREYCCSEMMEKALNALDGDRERAEELLSSLKENGYVDDSRYAAAFAREKSSLSGWGPVKIRYALNSKRIDRSVIDAALGEVDEARAEDRLEKLLQSKWKMLQGDPQSKLKLIKFALGRGYEYDDVRKAVEKIIDESI